MRIKAFLMALLLGLLMAAPAWSLDADRSNMALQFRCVKTDLSGFEPCGGPRDATGNNTLVSLGTALTSIADNIAPMQGKTLLNSATTSAVTTATTITLSATADERITVRLIEAWCNTAAATSSWSITDGGVAKFAEPLTILTTTPRIMPFGPTGLTAGTNSAVVITVNACTAGTSTLIVLADRSPVQ